MARVTPDPTPSVAEPLRVGPYSLHGILGEGATGVVYLGEQLEPVRRRVAIKVLKQEHDARTAARFALELEALARLAHPAIARMYEMGRLDDGRPYFVMEYVPGQPITAFCDSHRLDLHERLDLFLEVCAGVQYAHQRGVIHRDLKPSNVLVAEANATGEPKIIDFGLAKVRESAERPDLALTGGAILGTLDYMSPEQGTGGAEVDSRTDVYALGMILHQLLLGILPRTVVTGEKTVDVLRRVREDEPRRPSTRVGAAGADWEEIAARRRVSIRGLRRAVRGDLDCILQKALRREPDARYAAVAELAADVRRHLRSEPVLAHAPTLAYRFGRNALREKSVFWVTAMTLVGVASAASLTTSVLHRRAPPADDRMSLARVAQTIEERVTASHLRLEEALAGAEGRRVESARLLGEARDLADSALEGRATPYGTAKASGPAAEGFHRVVASLRRLGEAADERFTSGADETRAGRRAHADYHELYADVMRECSGLVVSLGTAEAPSSLAASWGISLALAAVLVVGFLGIRMLILRVR